ncbi:MAG: YraN family protein, partial [Cyanobium sp.]
MPPTPHQRQGRWAEQRALRLLQSRGWRLVSRNWHCRWGELDLVLSKPGRLLLVEVKGRGCGARDGEGLGALRRAKRKRLARAWA